MNPLALTAEEAAHQLGISRSKFFGLMASGDIASIKVGRSRRVPFASLEAFVAERLAERLAEQQSPRPAA